MQRTAARLGLPPTPLEVSAARLSGGNPAARRADPRARARAEAHRRALSDARSRHAQRRGRCAPRSSRRAPRAPPCSCSRRSSTNCSPSATGSSCMRDGAVAGEFAPDVVRLRKDRAVHGGSGRCRVSFRPRDGRRRPSAMRQGAGRAFIVVAAASAVFAALLIVDGKDPLRAYRDTLVYVFGNSYGFSELFVRMSPLILTSRRGRRAEPSRPHQRRRRGAALHGRLARDRGRAALRRLAGVGAAAAHDGAGLPRRRAMGGDPRPAPRGEARQRDDLDAPAQLRRAADRQLLHFRAVAKLGKRLLSGVARLRRRRRACRPSTAPGSISGSSTASSRSAFTASS